MATSSLASDFVVSLPSEVLLTIFGAQDSFRDISSFFRTCKSLYALWQTRASSISKPLLSRQTPCFPEVEALLLAHETANLTTKPRTTVILVDPILEAKLGKAMSRITSSRQIANQAKYVCEIIESRYLQQKYNCHDAKCRARPSTLAPQERDQVTRAHHFIKLYALTYGNKNLKKLHQDCENKLKAMSDADKHLLFQLTRIMHDYALPWDKMRLGLHSFCCENSGSDITWAEKFGKIQEVTRVQVMSCENCIYDDTARFSRVGQSEGN